MKALRLFVFIFIIFTGALFAYIFYEQHKQIELHNYSIIIISGIGLLLLIAGFILLIFNCNRCILEKDWMKNETEKLKTEYDKKNEYFEAQSKENDKRRAFEGRPKPEQQIVEIMRAAKLSSKTTKETIKEPKEEKTTKVTENEVNENEKFDTKIYEKAIEELKNMNQNNKQE
jgi:nitrate/TMAO reductase-like tetraheme cytochrome c subunit